MCQPTTTELCPLVEPSWFVSWLLLFFTVQIVVFCLSSNVSDSGISVFDESTTEFSTSGHSLRTDRSKSPVVHFKDEQISTSELVSEWLDQVEIQRSELLDTEEEQRRRRIGRILNETADRLNDEVRQEVINQLDAEYNREHLVQTVSLVGAVGLSIIIMFLLILSADCLVSGGSSVSVGLRI